MQWQPLVNRLQKQFIARLNENRGSRGTTPIKEAPAVYGSGEFLISLGLRALQKIGRRGVAPVFGSEKFLFVNQLGSLYTVFCAIMGYKP